MLETQTKQDLLANNISPPDFQSQLPYQWNEQIKVLGIVFDPQFTHKVYLQKLLNRAKVRQAVSTRLMHYNWGLLTNILGTTHKALPSSLVRYGKAAVGSGAHERALGALETQQGDIAARRVAGLGVSARIETLFATTNLLTVRNMYLHTCATLLDRTLRATSSTIQARMDQWLRRVYGVRDWRARATEISVNGRRGPRIGAHGLQEIHIQETWLWDLLESPPYLPRRFMVPSIFYTGADEITIDPVARAATYNFEGSFTWYETALQILYASGWGPESALADEINAERRLPPGQTRKAKLLIGSLGVMDWKPTPDPGRPEDTDLVDMSAPLDVEVATFLKNHYAISCSYMRGPNGDISCQGRIIGWDNTPVTPIYVREFAILHACQLVLDELKNKKLSPPPSVIQVRAGRHLDCGRLLRWFNEGRYDLKSTAGNRLISLLEELVTIIPCHMVLTSGGGATYREFDLELDRVGCPAGFVANARNRLLRFIAEVKRTHPNFLRRVPRAPLTKEEVHERIRNRNENDEIAAFKISTAKGSSSCAAYIAWDLSRAIIKQAMVELFFSKKLQVALASILTGTRFKYFSGRGDEDQSNLLPTICPQCGEVDSLRHLLESQMQGKMPLSHGGDGQNGQRNQPSYTHAGKVCARFN